KIRSVGIERTWKRAASPGCSSTFTLAIVTRPVYSWARSSRTGAIALHGPHHSAQKSTTTTSEWAARVWSNSASDRCRLVWLAMEGTLRWGRTKAHARHEMSAWGSERYSP